MAVSSRAADTDGDLDPSARPPRQRNARGQGSHLRDEIIEAATAILERTGDEASITLRAVAREVGIAPPSINRHFADRIEIIDAVVAQELAALRDVVATAANSDSDPVESLLLIIRAYCAYGQAHPRRYKVIFERRFLDVWADEQRTMEETAPLVAETFGLVVSAVEACVDAGRSSSTDPFADTTALWCALHGLVVLPPTIPSFPWPDADELLVACVTRLIGLSP